ATAIATDRLTIEAGSPLRIGTSHFSGRPPRRARAKTPITLFVQLKFLPALAPRGDVTPLDCLSQSKKCRSNSCLFPPAKAARLGVAGHETQPSLGRIRLTIGCEEVCGVVIVSGRALRLADAGQQSRVRRCGPPHARTWHRRQHGNLQLRRCRPSEAVAL